MLSYSEYVYQGWILEQFLKEKIFPPLHPQLCDTEEAMESLPILHMHPCCTSSHIAGTAKSLRIYRSHYTRAHMMEKICTIHIAGQHVWAVAQNVFTIKRQLIVYLQTTDYFFLHKYVN